ncbi:hypothetical protein [Niabella hibiscisoli]|uniref:hypothetical protein n=1 Tax=Niabella hibiscisoli TaxID=1825928 RepID=UPI001F0F4E69|nr:hypothetical protein [Niabella hibiscisoli]MCH5717286.1 hypothetical protein [Niabella hibiscisoli]
MAGNNQKKTEYIFNTVDAGMNVLADKPMVVNSDGFELLKKLLQKQTRKRYCYMIS